MVQDCPACLLAGSNVCLLVCLQYFAHHGVEAHLLALPTCEQNKELELVTTIADALEDFKINRWGHAACRSTAVSTVQAQPTSACAQCCGEKTVIQQTS